MHAQNEMQVHALRLVEEFHHFISKFLTIEQLKQRMGERSIHSLEYLLGSYLFYIFCPYRVKIRFSKEVDPQRRAKVEKVLGRLEEVERHVNATDMSLPHSLSPEALSPFLAALRKKVVWMNLSFWDAELGRMPLLAHVKLAVETDPFEKFWERYWNYTVYCKNLGVYTLNEFIAHCTRIVDYAVRLRGTEGPEGPALVIPLESPSPSLEKIAASLQEFEPCCLQSPLLNHASAIAGGRQLWIESSYQPVRIIYFFPHSLKDVVFGDVLFGMAGTAIVAVATSEFFDSLEYYFIKLVTSQVINRLLLLNLSNLSRRKTSAVVYHALRSAVAAIMSRNMSHNIGSHVLARIVTGGIDGWTQGLGVDAIVDKLTVGCLITQLDEALNSSTPSNVQSNAQNLCEELERRLQAYRTSQEPERSRPYVTEDEARSLVSWSKDIQVLARYLQQRMDFIAQVSTEWPTWSEPTWFMRDLMRWFLSQKHLLTNVAHSDGLTAYLYKQSTPSAGASSSPCSANQPLSQTGNAPETTNASEVNPTQEGPKQSSGDASSQSEEKLGDIRLHVFLVPEDCWDKFPENGGDVVRARRDQIQRGCTKDATQLPCKRSRDHSDQPCEQCHRILLYTGKDTLECRLDEDFQVAIPGGVVGQHAFFTILENIIRNAAKHGYSQQENRPDHLDVVIEVLYDPEEKVAIENQMDDQPKRIPAHLFRIYTNVSPVEGPDAVVRVDKINEILGKGIIKETGEMEKANWGHAEMKIAAGYLQRREIGHIGGQGQEITGESGKTMLELGMDDKQDGNTEGSRAIIRAVKSPISTLGYEFYIPRPRTVGIVCPDGGAS